MITIYDPFATPGEGERGIGIGSTKGAFGMFEYLNSTKKTTVNRCEVTPTNEQELLDEVASLDLRYRL